MVNVHQAHRPSLRDLLANGACITSLFITFISCFGFFDIHDDCFMLFLVLEFVVQVLVLVVIVGVPAILFRPSVKSDALRAYFRRLYGWTVAGLVLEVAHMTLRHYTARYHGGHCM